MTVPVTEAEQRDPEERERAELVRREPAGGGMTKIALRGSPLLHATYVCPGQYTEIVLGGEAGYFAIASRAGSPEWELVLRGGGGAADSLLTLPIGASVSITPALGRGFPCDEAGGRPLLVVVNGTGVSAARAVVAARIEGGDAARTEVYVGARARGEVALTAEMQGWAAAGVKVTVCLSQDAEAGAPYARGYVQDVVRARATSAADTGGMIFAVGSQAMIDALREIAPSVGIAPSDVRTNY